MTIQPPTVGLTLRGTPYPWLRNFDSVAVTTWNANSFYIGMPIDHSDCDKVIAGLRDRGISSAGVVFSLYNLPDWWHGPCESYVGATVAPDPFVHISPTNTLDPKFPGRCLGVVPVDLPIHVLSQPQGEIVRANFDVVYTRDVTGFLATLVESHFGDVVLENGGDTGYRRFFPHPRRRVLATEFMLRDVCTVCGTSIRGAPGVVLGYRTNNLKVCVDEQGIGHADAEFPLVLSVDVAVELKRQFPMGFGLQPIVDINSVLGRRIVDVFRQLYPV